MKNEEDDMANFGTRASLVVAVMLITPLVLVACGSSHTEQSALDGHGDLDRGSMSDDKVDPVGAIKAFDHKPLSGDKAICPVSGQVFVVTDGTAVSEIEGKHYAYCCPGCKPRFDADPAAFLGEAPAS